MTNVYDRRRIDMEDQASIIRYEEVLKRDRGNPPAFLAEHSGHDLGNEKFSKNRYTTKEWHDLEVEKLWKRVWQMACRENDIPEVGDQLEYQIAGMSIIVVRVGPDDIRAYHNACRHRGNRLVVGCNNATQLRCGFHGWTWDLEGRLERVPCRWDFPEVKDEDYGLPAVEVGRWNGLVFVNLSRDPEPFETFIGRTIPEHFGAWSKHRTWKAAHLGKVVPCNWKVALEAFIEIYHGASTHPDCGEYMDEAGTQYDFYGLHSRMLIPMGVPSPALGDSVEPQDVIDAMLGGSEGLIDGINDMFGDEKQGAPQLRRDEDPRHRLAEVMKGVLAARCGMDFSSTSDTESLDALEYFVFPNLVPWGGYFYPVVYRFRPNGNDPTSSIYEIMLMCVWNDDEPLPRDAPLQVIPFEQPWAETPGTQGVLGALLDQDMVTLGSQQVGLASDAFEAMTFANYQERNIRNFHMNLERYLDLR